MLLRDYLLMIRCWGGISETAQDGKINDCSRNEEADMRRRDVKSYGSGRCWP